MSKPAIDKLLARCSRADGPSCIDGGALTAEAAKLLVTALGDLGIEARVLDGKRVSGKPALLRAIAEAFAFPAHFGNNWDAVIDCWSDLSWMPAVGYVCVLLHADQLQGADSSAYDTFMEVFEDVAERWKEYDPTVVFKLVRGTTAAPPPRGK
jgi:RNAse (barnase) inhibitor barstar